MNILIVANHFCVCSARYAADAFTRLGHSVKHIGPAMGRDIWGMQVPEEYVWTPDSAGDFAPDIVIGMDSDPAILDALQVSKSSAYPLIIYGVDNHVRNYRRPYFDHYFLAHKSVSVMDWHEPNLVKAFGTPEHRNDETPLRADMTWLPCGFDPAAFPPSPIPWEQREYDVCMIGVLYPRRWELVQAMRDAGLKVLAGTGLVYDAYRAAYQNSRVALVSSFNGDLPIRTFEGCGLGCAVLTDKTPDLFSLDNKPIPVHVYEAIEQAVFEAKALQKLPEVAQQCAEWGQNHSWDKRAEKVIEWYNTRTA